MISSINLHLVNILLLGILVGYGKSYCSSSSCKNNKQLCQFQKSQIPARHCVDLEKLINDENDKLVILDKLNSRRNKVAAGDLRSFPSADNIVKLEWNTTLELSAQRWANRCVKTSVPDVKDACRDLENVGVGQNIATVYGESPGLLLSALVDVWYMELLNTNGSIIPRFKESNEGEPHYDYFTQLVWSDSSEVGCGGVKFKERLQDQGQTKTRTVYRLVCNFAPSGNRDNHSVYSPGAPCSKCPEGASCDATYSALCSNPSLRSTYIETSNKDVSDSYIPKEFINTELTTPIDKDLEDEVKKTKSSESEPDMENYTPFDYFSHLHELTRQTIIITTSKEPPCKDVLAVDDLIDLLKKRLSDDHMFKELLLATKATTTVPDSNFSDTNVAAFANRIYRKKQHPTTVKSTENELLNSTLLVDLVEAVIFRSGDKSPSREVVEQSTLSMSDVSPIKIQAELPQIQLNNDFTGHYFFPEDDEESSASETTESYYDGSNLSIGDVLMEIEDIKKNTITKNFLDDILESETSSETTTAVVLLPPDDNNAHNSGHEAMKKFLEGIKDKTGD